MSKASSRSATGSELKPTLIPNCSQQFPARTSIRETMRRPMMFHVKHGTQYDQESELLAQWASQLGITLDHEPLQLLLQHLDLMLAANSRVNLTSIRDWDSALRLHVLDSLAVLPILMKLSIGEIADLGSGGGFPGIPIAICTDRPVTLVESVKKKATFLQEAVTALDLGNRTSVSPLRAEEEALRRPRPYTAVTARALSSLPSLVELASPLLMEGGVLVAMKGRVKNEELAAGREAGEKVGMREVEVRGYCLPEGEEARAIVVYRRSGKTSIQLPRNTGMAQRRPLA